MSQFDENKPVWIIMGVSGCGKTTIGKLWSREISVPFYDADNFHPAENIKKMSEGIPLDDDDRFPWLEQLGAMIIMTSNGTGSVLACSALNEHYRDYLRPAGIAVHFIYLKADRELIRKRLSERKEHFMPEELIESQFEALEEPDDALTIDASLPPEEIIGLLKQQFGDPANSKK